MNSASATDLSTSSALDPHFAAVYSEHVDYVWTNLRRLGVPTRELDDAVQETFLVAFRRYDAFEEGASWRAWLFGIARRVAAHHRRSSGRRLRLVDAVAQEPRPTADPYDDVALRDAARLVHHFLQNLPPRRREVFILAELEGYTGAEIAHALDIKPNTAWSRLRSARESFERYLETLRARERGDAQRWDRAGLLRHAQEERVPDPARRRVMAALGVQLGMPAPTVALAGPAAALSLLKPAAIAIGLSVAALGSIAIGARVVSPPPAPREAAAAPLSVERQPTAPAEPQPKATTAPPPVAPKAVEPVAVAAASVAPKPSKPTAKPATPAPVDANALTAELSLMQELRAASKAERYEAVLALAQAHARRFPAGEMIIERDVQKIAALCRLRRDAQAATARTQFARKHPKTALPPPVVAVCDSAEEKSTKPGGPGQEK